MSHPSTRGYAYPINDIAVSLPSGTVVRIRNIVVFKASQQSGFIQNAHSNSVTIYIETPTPSDQPQRLAMEAKELLELQEKSPAVSGATAANIGVCRTRSCLEMREVPPEMYTFVRAANGSWEPERQP